MRDTAPLGSLSRAERIAATIKKYWADRGHTVEAHVVAEVQKTGEERGMCLYSVRTNLVNGMPHK